ncbi:MAG: hypothetical protein ABF246_05665, partial [Winogradskyella sp.]
METENSFVLKETSLSNNCPECYSKSGLPLIFSQVVNDTLLYRANSKTTTSKMYCKNCNTKIFPVRWTEDIERVVAYQKRALQLQPKTLKLKPLAWVILIL